MTDRVGPVTCARCGSTSPAGARACGGCGVSFAAHCASCGLELAAAARFCTSCGTPRGDAASPARADASPRLERDALRSRVALEGQRKQLTVLCVEMQDARDRAARPGAAAWLAVMDELVALATHVVQAAGGGVHQYTSDGIMALFGAPVAHEDHAQRACAGALRLRDTLTAWSVRRPAGAELPLVVRIGLSSGEVTVGTVSDDLRMSYATRGPTVELAARLARLAPPGGICLGESTARLVDGYFLVRELGRTSVKGAPAEITYFGLESVGPLQSRLERSRRAGLSPFVNRSAELAALRAALAQVRAGRGMTFGIAGEPGLGKSRICAEFLDECLRLGVEVHRAQCSPQRQVIALSPVRQVLRGHLGLAEDDVSDACRDAVEARLTELDPTLASAVDPTLELLGIAARGGEEIHPEARRRQVLRALASMAQRPEAPTVVAIDDAHWLDPESAAYFAQLADAIEGSHMLLLLNFRSGERPEWFRPAPGREMRLGPLHEDASRTLLRGLLGEDASLGPLQSLIGERTAGNPFFIEETVRSARELGSMQGAPGAYRLVDGTPDLHVPETVQSLIASRIDRLPQQDKQILSIAAVIGKSFDSELLARVATFIGDVRAPLARLCDAGFVTDEGTALGRGHRYAFGHPLTHEVAYTALLPRARAETHSLIADVLREAPSEELRRRSPTIAQHLEAAGRWLEAAEYRMRAARWSHPRDHHESFRHLQSLWRLCGLCPPSPERDELLGVACLMLLANGWRHGLRLEHARELFERGVEIAREQRSAAREASVYASFGRIVAAAESADAYLAKVERALEIARGEDEEVQLRLRAMLTDALHRCGRLEASLTVADEVVARLGSPRRRVAGFDFSPQVWVRTLRAQTLTWLGRFQIAHQEMAALLATDEEDLSVDLRAFVVLQLAELAWARQDAQGVLEVALQANELAEARGSAFSIVMARNALGVAQLLGRRWDDAERTLGSALELMRSAGAAQEFLAQGLALLAEAKLRLGRPREALELACDALAGAERLRMRYYVGVTGLCKARMLLRQGEPRCDDAEQALAAVDKLGREIGARIYLPYLEAERAEIERRRGHETEYRRRFERALELFEELGGPRGDAPRPGG